MMFGGQVLLCGSVWHVSIKYPFHMLHTGKHLDWDSALFSTFLQSKDQSTTFKYVVTNSAYLLPVCGCMFHHL